MKTITDEAIEKMAKKQLAAIIEIDLEAIKASQINEDAFIEGFKTAQKIYKTHLDEEYKRGYEEGFEEGQIDMREEK